MEKKKMKNLSKKLVMSIVAVTLVVAALGASTFAWFTLSNRASVGTFEAEVTAGEGIEISLDGVNWYTDIPTSIIMAKIGEVTLVDVTTNNATDFYRAKVEGGVVVPAVVLEGNPVKQVGGYVDFELYFRSQTLLDIHWTEVQLGSTPFNWTPDANFTLSNDDQVIPLNIDSGNLPVDPYYKQYTVNAADAARVAIVGDQTFVYEKPTVTAALGTNESNGILGNSVFTSGTVEAPNFGAISYWNTKNTNNQFPGTVLFSGLAQEIRPFVNTIQVIDETTNSRNVLTLSTGNSFATGNTPYGGTVDVRVWIEGWDAEAFNAVLSKTISVSLRFEGKE